MELWGIPGALPRAQPSLGCAQAPWTLWLLFLGELCTDTALGERALLPSLRKSEL